MGSSSRGGSKFSNGSLLERLSCNIFITNFSSHLTAKELWNSCTQHGTVLDVYILKKLSKQGKPFSFARFNKVNDVDSLICNLRSVWFGNFWLYATVARFNRVSSPKTPAPNPEPKVPIHCSGTTPSFARIVKGKDVGEQHDEPIMFLERGTLNYAGDHVLMGCVKDFKHFLTSTIFVPVKQLIVESFKVILEGKIYVVRAKEITRWVLDFDMEDVHFKDASDINLAGFNNWKENALYLGIDDMQSVDVDANVISDSLKSNKDAHENVDLSGDPFSLEKLILKSTKSKKVALESSGSDPKFPPRFTLSHSFNPEMRAVIDSQDGSSSLAVEGRNSLNASPGDSGKDHVDSMKSSTKPINEFSIIEHFQEFINISQAMDFGTWMSINIDVLFMAVYAPQELSRKRQLWSYMAGLIHRWLDEVVAIGDFNEVRFSLERYGSIFHAYNATEFNAFIANSHLINIPFGGFSFTWSEKYGSKTSKLDRFLISEGILEIFPNLTGLILHRRISDHKPIILKESQLDYCPTPFRLFHSWFLEHDFIQKKNSMENDRKTLQDTMVEFDLCLDRGKGLLDDLLNCANIFRNLGEIDSKISTDLAQKAKIKWAIEGDENSNFYHGIVNKKRRQQAIKGILVDGAWIDNPNRVDAC
ncbi:RNA-directed DNA polymerase, eukaryota [Tanacetum coccineum]